MPLKRIINQTQSTPIVDKNGVPTIAFFNLIEDLVGLEILEGDGSPELVVKAKQKTLYFDLSGSSGSIVYIKTTGPSLGTGWVAI